MLINFTLCEHPSDGMGTETSNLAWMCQDGWCSSNLAPNPLHLITNNTLMQQPNSMSKVNKSAVMGSIFIGPWYGKCLCISLDGIGIGTGDIRVVVPSTVRLNGASTSKEEWARGADGIARLNRQVVPWKFVFSCSFAFNTDHRV